MARKQSVIRAKRRLLDLTQQELADKLNVSRASVNAWEMKKTSPSVHQLLRLNDILDISLDELVEDYNKEVSK